MSLLPSERLRSHTFATHLYHKTGDLYLVQRALGHRQITTTEVYARVSDEALRRSVTDQSLRHTFATRLCHEEVLQEAGPAAAGPSFKAVLARLFQRAPSMLRNPQNLTAHRRAS